MDYDHIKLIKCPYHVMMTNDTYLIIASDVMLIGTDYVYCLEENISHNSGWICKVINCFVMWVMICYVYRN